MLVPMDKAAFDRAWRECTMDKNSEFILVYLAAACCNCGKIEGLGCTCVEDRKNAAPLVLCDRCRKLPAGHPAEHLCGYGRRVKGKKSPTHLSCYALWLERRADLAKAWLAACNASCTRPGMCRVAPNPFCSPVSARMAALDPWTGVWRECC